ncbi:MAG: hypothetical protein IT426_08820 [Pirellulales bacterium]|nr:hypothetical protein [Pirellulales bacterium]
MGHEVFYPRTAAREEKRQANEALGRSFCKTLAEPITNSDSSAKRKLKIPQASGLVDFMLSVSKGTQMDTEALRARLKGRYPRRVVVVEVVTSKSTGRQVGEIVVIDQAEGMSTANVKRALYDIAGDRSDLAGGIEGRNLFGRGLSDVMRAHSIKGQSKDLQPLVQTFDGKELTIAQGEWGERWTINLRDERNPPKAMFKETFLDPSSEGTAIRFVISDRARAQGCKIPDHPKILWRLANFYILRLIASDPNVELVLRQYRKAKEIIEAPIQYNFPVGQVIESFSRTFEPAKFGLEVDPLKADFVIVRSESEHPLAGGALERDGRERGILIVDDLDAVYDLTFVDPDYERADYLARIYGVIRVNGLRTVLESYLNAEPPTSPLLPTRDGFNRDHEFAKALIEFLAENLRPIYEKERKIAEEKDRSNLSSETKKRIDDALKHLNKYFQQITELTGGGVGPDPPPVPKPTDPVVFFPKHTKPTAGRPRQVLLLVRDDIIKSGAEVVASASEGISVEPETARIDKKECPRWPPHKEFFALQFSLNASIVGQKGKIDAVVEGKDGDIEALLQIEDVLAEQQIEVPETLEFRPIESMGRPGRRNNLVLFVNPAIVSAGKHVGIKITKRTGSVMLISPDGENCDVIDVKLDLAQHLVKGQEVFRVLIPWKGTGWGQHAQVQAIVKIGGEKFTAVAKIRLDEAEDGGFFKDVKYYDLGEETLAPSKIQPGEIVINSRDRLNREIFGEGETTEELKAAFDRSIRGNPIAQQRLATLLVEEASYRALEHLHRENKLLGLTEHREVTVLHEAIDKYKYESAFDVYKALTKSKS